MSVTATETATDTETATAPVAITFPDKDEIKRNTLQYYDCNAYINGNTYNIVANAEIVENLITWLKRSNPKKGVVLPLDTFFNIKRINPDSGLVEEYQIDLDGVKNLNANLSDPIGVAMYVLANDVKINNNEFIPTTTDDNDLNRAIFYLNYNKFWQYVISVNEKKCSKDSTPFGSSTSNVDKLPKFDPLSLKNGSSKFENFKEWNKITGINTFGSMFGGNPKHHPFGGNVLPDNLTAGRGQVGGEPCNQQIKRIVDSVLSMTRTKFGDKSGEHKELKDTLDGLLDDNIQTEVLINQKVQQLQRLAQSGSSASSVQSKELVEHLQKLVEIIAKNQIKILDNVQVTWTNLTPSSVPKGVPAYDTLKGGNGDVNARLNAMQNQLNKIAMKLGV